MAGPVLQANVLLNPIPASVVRSESASTTKGPSLIEIHPLGKAISRIITSVPGGSGWISILYGGFSRLHDNGSCWYHMYFAASKSSPAERVSKDPLLGGPSRFRCGLAGLLGGLLGSLAMGVVVPLPDALCLQLATDIVVRGPNTYPLAWTFHIVTGVVIGGVFGFLVSIAPLRGWGQMPRSIPLGLLTGVLVWAGFFTPSMIIFTPSAITNHILETSFAAHVIFGLVWGTTLGTILTWSGVLPEAQ